MADFLDINGYAWTEPLQEWVEGGGYDTVCFLFSQALPLYNNPDTVNALEQQGWQCYSVGLLRADLEAVLAEPSPGGGGGGETEPPEEPPPVPITDPGVPDLPPPADIPPEPPPQVIPPPIETPPPVAPPFPVLFPGVIVPPSGTPFLPGNTVTARLVNGLGSFLGALLGGIFGGDSGAQIQRLRYDMVNLGNALWSAIKSLKGVLDAVARASGAIVHVLHDIWHKGIKPVLDHIKEIGARINRIIDKVLKPYLLWMQRMRKLILDIYVKIVLPILNVIQAMRKALALLRLAHVPFAKKLDARLQRLEAKLVHPIQVLLQRVNDHSGIINEIISIQHVLQEPLFTGSINAYQYNLVNSWWASQTVPRTAAQEQEAAALQLQLQSHSGEKLLDDLVRTDVYTPPSPAGPGQRALDDLLVGGPQ